MGFPVQALLNNDINRFYNNKSILHTYNFYVDFSGINPNINTWKGQQIIHSYHVSNIDIPTYKFEKPEALKFGVYQYTYPVLSKEQPIDIRLTMEEDVYGRVGRFIDLCQDTIIRGDGYYRSPNYMKSAIGDLFVYMGDEKKESVYVWKFPKLYFLGAEPLNLGYDDNSAMKYVVTFGCDKFERYSRSFVYDEFPRQPYVKPSEVQPNYEWLVQNGQQINNS